MEQRLIDANEVLKHRQDHDLISTHIIYNAPTVEAIPKADYETRLKADLVAILEELDLQIDESSAYNLEAAKVQRLIRKKINALKTESEGKE